MSAQLEELSKQVQLNTQLLQAHNKVNYICDEQFNIPVTTKDGLHELNSRLSSIEDFSKLV